MQRHTHCTQLKTIIYKQKTCGVRTKNAQTKHYDTKNIQKIPLSAPFLAIYCWVWGLSLRVFHIPNKILGETNFSFANGYQLEIASGLGMWAGVHFHFQHWVPIKCRYMLALYMSQSL